MAFTSRRPSARTARGSRQAGLSRRACRVVCQAKRVAVLPGDGIGPEITDVALKVLSTAGQKEGVSFEYKTALIGGAAIDATGVPLPPETLEICKASDAVLLAAIGGWVCPAEPAVGAHRGPADALHCMAPNPPPTLIRLATGTSGTACQRSSGLSAACWACALA